MSTCRFCGATLRWVQLDTGKPIPVDPIPHHDKGNVAAKPQGTTLVGHVISQAKPLQAGQLRYMPHHASCKPDEPRITASERPQALFDLGEPA